MITYKGITLSAKEWSKHPWIKELNRQRVAKFKKPITFSVIKYREAQMNDPLTKYTPGQVLGFEEVKKKPYTKMVKTKRGIVGSAATRNEFKTKESLLALTLSRMRLTEVR